MRSNIKLGLLIAAVLFGLGLLTYAVLGRSKSNANSAADSALVHANTATDNALVHECIKFNIKNATDNSSHLANYKADVAEYTLYQFVLARFSAPTKTETKAQKKVTNQFLGELRADVTGLQTAVATYTWQALNDCNDVTNLDSGEVEVYTVQGMMPPWYALGKTPQQLANAARTDPVGSIP